MCLVKSDLAHILVMIGLDGKTICKWLSSTQGFDTRSL
uniref:Uncharacterized protein n=1 Tax=Rhizophora mucronata TaxID=61149 RepID=A0A2P2PRN8_RHIMU